MGYHTYLLKILYYLKKNIKGTVGPDELGCIVDGDNIDPLANPNDCKNLIAKNFVIEDANLAKVRNMFGEFMGSKPIKDDYVWKSKGAKDVIEITEDGCEMTKTYKIESKCEGTLYLSRNKKSDIIEEICIDDLTDPE